LHPAPVCPEGPWSQSEAVSIRLKKRDRGH
jgi:hypothetical protein